MRTAILIAIVSVLLVSAYFAWNHLQQKANSHAEQIELRAVYDRWNDGGRPTGEELLKFMQGRRNFLINSQSFIVGETNYVGQFALTNLISHENGMFVITTNKELLLIISNRPVEIIQFSPPPW